MQPSPSPRARAGLALTLAAVLATTSGCFGNTRYSPGVAASNSSSNQANIAARANEPRTADPTAAAPPTMLPTAGATASLQSTPASPAAPPSRPSSSPEPTAPPPAGESEGPTASATAPAAPAKAQQEGPKRIGARHVLVQWMGSERAPTAVVRSREQALVVAQQVLKRAKAGDDFARLAVEFSDEPGAAARGGSLGRFGRGQMVGAFETAAFKLEVGQISGIVESPFGYHIIQRTE